MGSLLCSAHQPPLLGPGESREEQSPGEGRGWVVM